MLVSNNNTHPSNFELYQNYPNTFNPFTTIRYDLPEAADVTITVYNTYGQKVASLVKSRQNKGYHTVDWDASDMSSGVYFYKLKAGRFTSVKKCLVMK